MLRAALGSGGPRTTRPQVRCQGLVIQVCHEWLGAWVVFVLARDMFVGYLHSFVAASSDVTSSSFPSP